ncbi:hypothetical protein CH72_2940 [Burkholderia ambifaria AMMD]|uniref:hypothetical protein n=1 Tax=Burkholderia ambifaria TaxID=152480 RepID=UPI0005A076B1|nr:hypothetical protein [Burkholderia ambifaria]AJY20710.1 hypothetical protein CH72_2940 [Burkholderia ambifaria AMMD]MBR7928922.1 hypothetical protein [Burkholderia ambifaria]PEH65361.1 hypothetical protein CRM91_23685 [Burkholderia ambifaria]QQC05356.1 hypothetical protein I6H84_05495 [Burkholderia ambifaria]UZU03864.1 hypothetical protein OR987_26735 [Burkholderia ambifaria]
MPRIKLDITDGDDKENFKAATIANCRWGDNGEKVGTALDIAVGTYTITITKVKGATATGSIEIRETDSLIELTVDKTGCNFDIS